MAQVESLLQNEQVKMVAALEQKTTVAAAATTTLDASLASSFLVTLGVAATTLAVINGVDGQVISIIFRQDATGTRTVTYPSNVKGGTAPSAGANSSSAQSFVYDAANSAWYSLGAASTGM